MNGKMADILLRLKGNVFVNVLLYPLSYLRVAYYRKKYKKNGDDLLIEKFHNCHLGQRCFVIGNGPSLSIDDLELLKGEYTFGVNRIYNLFDQTTWRPSYYMATDAEFIRSEWKNIEKVNSIKFLNNRSVVDKIKNDKELIPVFINEVAPIRRYSYIKRTISTDLKKGFSMNYSVVCFAIELAIYMGFTEIYLLGVDHNYPKEIKKTGKTIRKNVQEHFQGGSYSNGAVSYYIDTVTGCFEAYKQYAKKNNIVIKNATRGGKLEVFERERLEKVIFR